MRPLYRTITLSAILAALLVAQTAPSAPGTPSLSIGGDAPTHLTLSIQDLDALPRTTLTLQEHTASAKYEGVALIDILKKAGVPFGKQLRGKALASYIVAVGHDGYEVVFSLAEIDPGLHDSQIIVADQREGKPIEGDQGPLRLVAATDKLPARSVRMLEKIDVVMLRK